MSHYTEALVKQHLWHYLESEKDWVVDGEVPGVGGRIDLACRTPQGEYVGIELKSEVPRSSGSYELYQQVKGYLESGKFDCVYLATPDMSGSCLDNSAKTPLRPLLKQAIDKLNNGIEQGEYTGDEVWSRIDEEIDEHFLSQKYFGISSQSAMDYMAGTLQHGSIDWGDFPVSEANRGETITIEEGIKKLKEAHFPEEVGLVEVPLPLQDGYMKSPKEALTPGGAESPTLLKDGEKLDREGKPNISRVGEPWVRHSVWQEFGGIPEGLIPNVMDSPQVERPIDVITFRGSFDPPEILKEEEGEVIGIEAKGGLSLTTSGLETQLRDQLEPQVLTKLYLAVPVDLEEEAVEYIRSRSTLREIGVLSVDRDGRVNEVSEAHDLSMQHDGFKRGLEDYKTGYGSVDIPDGDSVQSPFRLDEYRDPPKDNSGEVVVWDYDPLDSDRVIDDVDDLNETSPAIPKEDIESMPYSNSNLRTYLLEGYSAEFYGEQETGEPRKGYVRLSLNRLDTESSKYGLNLHFGKGTWEGGQVYFIGEQLEDLISVVASVENIDSYKFSVPGEYMDLSVTDKRDRKHKLDGSSLETVDFVVSEVDAVDGKGVLFNLEMERTKGVRVSMTETQRIDFLKSVRIDRFGRPSQLKGSELPSYRRIGPYGHGTWDLGRDIEKEHEPDPIDPSDPELKDLDNL